MAWAVWITGLPGSGKTLIAQALEKEIKEKAVVLKLDAFRKKLVKDPEYIETERDYVYKALGHMAVYLVNERNENVIIDATAHKKEWRDYLRSRVKKFIEIYVKCPMKLCIERESKRKSYQIQAEMYEKALQRKKTGQEFRNLGQVVGIDVPYEANEKAEVVIESDKITPEETAKIIVQAIEKIK